MTTLDDRTPTIPSFSDADFRTVRLATMRRLAQRIVDGELEPQEGRQQILATSRRAAPNLDESYRDDACEQLVKALGELDRVRDDMWDPAEGDRRELTLIWDCDAENALKKLLGGAR